MYKDELWYIYLEKEGNKMSNGMYAEIMNKIENLEERMDNIDNPDMWEEETKVIDGKIFTRKVWKKTKPEKYITSGEDIDFQKLYVNSTGHICKLIKHQTYNHYYMLDVVRNTMVGSFSLEDIKILQIREARGDEIPVVYII